MKFLRFLPQIIALLAMVAAPLAAQQPEGGALRPNDRVEIRVFQEEDLTQLATVSERGTVRLSLIGPISVAGLSPEQAAQRIRQAYAKGFLVNPQVSVSLMLAAKRLVFVTGHVARQGPVEIKAGERMSLVQAIAEAGGLTRLASQRSVSIKRTTGGRERRFEVNYKKLVTDPNLPPFYLEEGDIVTVKEALF